MTRRLAGWRWPPICRSRSTSGDVELWFQPQAAASTGGITGFEALVRWRHPEFGMITPEEIIAVAHRTGHMRRLTDAIVGHALDARRAWYDAGHELDVAVNVTPRDISDPTLVDTGSSRR